MGCYGCYLVAAGKTAGLFLNFGERKVESKRKIEDLTEAIDRMIKRSSQSCYPV